jgi:aerobic carbon-monoxide dehydrogenase medium subunit
MLLPADFALHRPRSLAEALRLRAELGEDAAPYAGGTELLLTMKLGVIDYGHLIDLKRVPELAGIERRDGVLRIGARATHREIELSPLVRSAAPALAELEHHVANVRVRAAGTLAGNLAFAEPHADPGALLAAAGATVELAGPDGQRELAVEEFLVGAYETALESDELITAVRVPVADADVRAAYRKFQVLERPTVGAAAVGRVVGGVFAAPPSVVVGAVDERPIRVPADALAGAAPGDADALEEICAAARDAVDPVDDLAGSADYKRHLTGVLVGRALAALADEEGSP